jgi:quinoprotein glucose dehydrogenase
LARFAAITIDIEWLRERRPPTPNFTLQDLQRMLWFSMLAMFRFQKFATCFLVLALGTITGPLAGRAEEEVNGEPISPAAQLSAASFRVEPGYKVTPVASEPLFANPVAFCFDPQGRIFVAETHRVHHGTEDNRNHMDWLDDDLAAQTVAQRRAYVERRMADRLNHYTEASELVRLLEDRDGDGVYDHSCVFSDGYNEIESGAAAGVMWVGDRLLFTCIPDLWELRDADGDGKAEERKSLATGFGVHFALFGHDLHGLVEGPDGKIYFSIGDRGLHVETPNGVLSNPDSGSVIRCNPDGSELELFATGLRNPQELAFNELGDLFSVDNNSDSGDRARIVQIVEGMNTGWRMSYQYLPDRGPFNREKIWHTKNAEQPAGIVPPIAHLSDGPSGLVYYPGTGMTDDCRDSFFLADFRGAPASSGIRRFHLEQEGAGYRLANDKMFMEGILVTDCDFGPDGNFYVSDWIEGWNGTGMGRLYRVADDDPELVEARRKSANSLKQVPTLKTEQLVDLLGNPNMRVRQAAQRQLVALGATSAKPLAELARKTDASQLARIHAIWGLGSLAIQDPTLFDAIATLCGNADAEIRNQAARTLGRAKALPETERSEFGAGLAKLLGDPSLRVRASAAASIGSLGYQPALAELLKAASDNAEVGDAIVRTGIVMGLAGSQSESDLINAAKGADQAARVAIVLALAKQKSPRVGEFMADDSETVVLEAARATWDTPIVAANGALAAALNKISPTNEPLVRRSLAASQAMRAPAYLQGVIQFAMNPDAPAAMRDHAWELVSQWAAPSSRDPVHGQWRPLEPQAADEVRDAMEQAWPGIRQASAADPTGVIIAAELGLPAALNDLPTLLERPDLDAKFQVRAIAAMDHADDAVAERVIEFGLQSPDGRVRSAARRLLAERFPAKAIDHLTWAANEGETRERQAALALLAKIDLPAAHQAIDAWMTRAEQGDCPQELLLEVLEAAQSATDKSLVERHKKLVDQQAASGDLASLYAAAVAGGDAARGEQLFLSNESLSCRRCHSLTPGEQLVGPSLADVGAKRTRQEIIESVTRPNAKIVEGFQTTSMLLDTGMVVTGILRHEDDEKAVLLNADGKEVEVDLETVEDSVQGLSAMPEDLMKFMSQRDLRDVVEFLSSQRNASASSDAGPKTEAGHELD